MEVVEEQELTKVEEVVNQFLIEELKSDAYESERIKKLVILVWSPGCMKAQSKTGSCARMASFGVVTSFLWGVSGFESWRVRL